ncbi:unnamed protein product [Symbiodinium sp. KB8]|nr:unnamed protein product [Symbiodinium sp. KB8]
MWKSSHRATASNRSSIDSTIIATLLNMLPQYNLMVVDVFLSFVLKVFTGDISGSLASEVADKAGSMLVQIMEHSPSALEAKPRSESKGEEGSGASSPSVQAAAMLHGCSRRYQNAVFTACCRILRQVALKKGVARDLVRQTALLNRFTKPLAKLLSQLEKHKGALSPSTGYSLDTAAALIQALLAVTSASPDVSVIAIQCGLLRLLLPLMYFLAAGGLTSDTAELLKDCACFLETCIEEDRSASIDSIAQPLSGEARDGIVWCLMELFSGKGVLSSAFDAEAPGDSIAAAALFAHQQVSRLVVGVAETCGSLWDYLVTTNQLRIALDIFVGGSSKEVEVLALRALLNMCRSSRSNRMELLQHSQALAYIFSLLASPLAQEDVDADALEVAKYALSAVLLLLEDPATKAETIAGGAMGALALFLGFLVGNTVEGERPSSATLPCGKDTLEALQPVLRGLCIGLRYQQTFAPPPPATPTPASLVEERTGEDGASEGREGGDEEGQEGDADGIATPASPSATFLAASAGDDITSFGEHPSIWPLLEAPWGAGGQPAWANASPRLVLICGLSRLLVAAIKKHSSVLYDAVGSVAASSETDFAAVVSNLGDVDLSVVLALFQGLPMTTSYSSQELSSLSLTVSPILSLISGLIASHELPSHAVSILGLALRLLYAVMGPLNIGADLTNSHGIRLAAWLLEQCKDFSPQDGANAEATGLAHVFVRVDAAEAEYFGLDDTCAGFHSTEEPSLFASSSLHLPAVPLPFLVALRMLNVMFEMDSVAAARELVANADTLFPPLTRCLTMSAPLMNNANSRHSNSGIFVADAVLHLLVSGAAVCGPFRKLLAQHSVPDHAAACLKAAAEGWAAALPDTAGQEDVEEAKVGSAGESAASQPSVNVPPSLLANSLWCLRFAALNSNGLPDLFLPTVHQDRSTGSVAIELVLRILLAPDVTKAAEAAPTPTPSETHLEDAFSGSFSTTAALASTCGRRAVDDPLSTVIDFHGEVSNPFEQRTETAETIAMHWWLQVQKTLHALLAMVTGHRNAWTAFSEAHSTALTGLVKRIAAVSDGKQTPTTEASPAAQTPAERVKSMRKALWSPLQSAKEAATRTLRMALLLEGAGPYHKAIDACGIPALCTETLAKLLTRSEVVEAAKARLRHPADPVPSNRQIGLLPYQFWLLEVLHDAIRGPSGSKVLPEIYKTLTETLTQTLQEKGVDEDLDVETVYLAADGVVAEVTAAAQCVGSAADLLPGVAAAQWA